MCRRYLVVAALLSLAVAAACAANNVRSSICRDSAPVSWSETLTTADSAKLYLLTRGDHRDAPIILWLHGGPGAAERPLFRLYNGALEHRFVVAYWDQRGAGDSFDTEMDPKTLTVATHLKDLDLVVDHLRRRLNRDKIILVGHSWGAALGLLYAKNHPRKVAAVVGVAPLLSGIDSEWSQYRFIMTEAEKYHDQSALDAMAAIGTPPFNADEVLDVQALVDHFGGYFHHHPSFVWVTISAVVHGYIAPWDIPRFIRANNFSLKAMHDELLALDLHRVVPSVGVPVIFMLGKYDRQIDTRLATAYFDRLAAPEKKLIWFAESAHNIPFEEPERFNRLLETALANVHAK